MTTVTPAIGVSPEPVTSPESEPVPCAIAALGRRTSTGSKANASVRRRRFGLIARPPRGVVRGATRSHAGGRHRRLRHESPCPLRCFVGETYSTETSARSLWPVRALREDLRHLRRWRVVGLDEAALAVAEAAAAGVEESAVAAETLGFVEGAVGHLQQLLGGAAGHLGVGGDPGRHRERQPLALVLDGERLDLGAQALDDRERRLAPHARAEHP